MIKLKGLFGELGKNKKNIIVILCATLALLLLAVSELADNEESAGNMNNYVSSEAYIKEQEKKLCELLEKIDGVGDVEVMITLESCYENVYLKDKNLKVTLNLHPSLGVRKWESMFDKFANSLDSLKF